MRWNLTPPWRLWAGNFYENNTVGDNGQAIYGDVFDTYNISVRGKDPSFFNVFDYDKHKNYIRKRVKSTCDWVLQNDTFINWRQNTQSSVMFVTAYPGCGKSVLSRAIVDENIVGDGYTTLYFFFQDRRKQRNATSALCSLLHQLFKSHQYLFNKYGQQALKEVGESLKFEFQALWDLFLRAVADPAAGQIVCVLDGLDECEEDGRHDLLRNLKEMYNNTAGKTSENLKLRFFITSRPYPEIDSHLEKFPKRHLLRIQDKHCLESISKDVDRVARKIVRDLARKKHLPVKVERKILRQLLRNSQRTCLWITLVCKRIDKQQHLDETDWLSFIDSLPQTKTVDDCYKSFLSHCEQSDKALAILTIVIGAKRPLTLQELGLALAIEQRKTPDGKLKPLGEEAIEHSLRCLCGFLLSVSDSKVDLFHPTVKDFLLCSNDTSSDRSMGKWQHSLNKSSCDHTMAEICVQYLLSQNVQRGRVRPDNDSSEIHNKGNDSKQAPLQLESEDMGFLDYAATFWAEHYREAEIDRHDALEGLARKLCRVDSESYKIWFPIFWWRRTGRSSKIGYFTDIGVATFLGHKTIVNRLLRDKVKVDDNCGEFGFPLYVAAWTGDKGMSELLLEKGADINQVNGNHGNALYAALTNRKNDVVFLLLENEADIHSRGGMYGTILQAAAVKGDDKVVRALLERGANVNERCSAKEGYWPDALTAAAWNNHESTARILLEAGAEIVHTEYGSPLYGACFNNHEGLVRLFLESKAEVNGRGGEFGYLLQAAAWNASTAIVQLLLDNGASIDAVGGYFGTALSAASYRGNEAIVRLLLETGARQLEGGEFGNPSKAAVQNNHTHINLILLEALKQSDGAR